MFFFGVVVCDSFGQVLGSKNVIGDGTTNTATNGRLDLNGHSPTISDLEGSGEVTTSGSGDTLKVVSGTFDGLVSGPVALDKVGAGTLYLTNDGNDYSGGTTIDGGNLEFDYYTEDTYVNGVLVGSPHDLKRVLLPEAYKGAVSYASQHSTTVNAMTEAVMDNYTCYHRASAHSA